MFKAFSMLIFVALILLLSCSEDEVSTEKNSVPDFITDVNKIRLEYRFKSEVKSVNLLVIQTQDITLMSYDFLNIAKVSHKEISALCESLFKSDFSSKLKQKENSFKLSFDTKSGAKVYWFDDEAISGFEQILVERDPLHLAVIEDDLSQIKNLLASGLSVKKGALYPSPLTEVRNGQPVALGEKPANWSAGESLLETAIKSDFDNSELISLLLSEGAQLENSVELISYFISNKKNKTLEKLLKQKYKSSELQEFLYTAIRLGNIDAVKYLIDTGVNLNPAGGFNQHAIIWALEYRRNNIVKLLLESGASAKVRGVLKLAVYNKELVNLLVEKGARENEINQTAYELKLQEAEKVIRNVKSILYNSKLPGRQKSLENLLEKYTEHPAESDILVALSSIIEDEDKKVKYLRRASNSPFKANPWGYAQQDAALQLATLLEKRGDLRGARQAIRDWVVSGSCGTGLQESEVFKEIELYRLSIQIENSESLRAKMWLEIVSLRLRSRGDLITKALQKIYEKEGLEKAEADFKIIRHLAKNSFAFSIHTGGLERDKDFLEYLTFLEKSVRDSFAK